jgi:phosphopantothenoylcysteine decarboxylase / phosphopantothenate---cysteine ligase
MSDVKKKKNFKDLHVLVTAGPTQEYIDPVRYLSNPSSGQMGYSLAEAAKQFGARVTLLSGPTHLTVPTGVKKIDIVTAQDLYQEALKIFPKCDVLFMAAAVADYRPAKKSASKIKKQDQEGLVLDLVATRDTLKSLGSRKKPHQYLVGFAAETNRLLDHAKTKLEEKKLNLIVANKIAKGNAFGASTNQVTLIYADGRTEILPKLSKKQLAEKLVRFVVKDL